MPDTLAGAACLYGNTNRRVLVFEISSILISRLSEVTCDANRRAPSRRFSIFAEKFILVFALSCGSLDSPVFMKQVVDEILSGWTQLADILARTRQRSGVNRILHSHVK